MTPHAVTLFRTTWARRLAALCLGAALAGCQAGGALPAQDQGVYLVPPSPTPLIAASDIQTNTEAAVPAVNTPAPGEGLPYQDATQPVTARVNDLLARMTLIEKIGQMTQAEYTALTPAEVTTYYLGSVLSGGGAFGENTPPEWQAMVTGYEQAALQTRLGIPLIFGIDAVHGNGHLATAVFFPQNIGLGATRDAALVEKIGRVTGIEVAALGVRWNFAPCVAVVQDTRWGRTYEGYSENTALVTALAGAYVRGLQGPDLTDPTSVIASAKHYLGDGGTTFGSSTTVGSVPYLLDQGDTRVDEATLRARFLPPYQAAVQAGTGTVMASFSSWNGVKMHGNQHLLTDVLKGELGFKGFIISDWQGVDQVAKDYYTAVVTSINAGMDMVMVPTKYMDFISTLYNAVQKGDVPQTRIDDAVRRILTVKFEMGLFERPLNDPALLAQIGTAEHRALARQAVRESAVLLKNENHTLPLSKTASLLYVAGQAAEDIGLQSGGWTIEWQGKEGKIAEGTTVLQGLRQAAPGARVVYDRFALFPDQDAQGNPAPKADVGVVVLAEKPYAEGVGDAADPKLTDVDITLLEKMRAHSQKVVVVLMSGRPLEITAQWPLMDALVAAWLPGTEGNGVADVLFGDYPFTGKLPYTWQRWNSQLPFDFSRLPTTGCDAPLFAFGYGLDTGSPSPALPDCPKP